MTLPETSLLVTFESIARQASFRAAADELHLTPSAVSHRLNTLETVLGRDLITRTTRHVSLTPAGDVLLAATRSVVSTLDDALRRLEASSHAIVTITTTDSVAACWLIDRLPLATADLDAIEVRILTVAAGVPFDPFAADLGIAYGRDTDWPRGDPILVAAETIAPVCTPDIADTITFVDDLWSRPLLADTNLHVGWQEFAQDCGATPETVAELRTQATYNHSHLALRAASSGQGVALAGTPLVNDAVTRGDLVRPVPQQITTPNGYYLVRSHQRRAPHVEAVRSALRDVLTTDTWSTGPPRLSR